MSAVNIQLPDWLVREAKRLADEDKVTLDHFMATALAEKVSAVKTVAYLQERAARGDQAKFLAALSRAPNAAPVEGDEL